MSLFGGALAGGAAGPDQDAPQAQQVEKAAKEGKGMFQALVKSRGVMELFREIMKSMSGFVEMGADFIGILTGGMEAGLSDALKLLAETLFNPDTVAFMRQLGELMGETTSMGLVPLIELMQLLVPLLGSAVESLKWATKSMEGFSKEVMNIKAATETLTDVMQKLGVLFESNAKWGSGYAGVLSDLNYKTLDVSASGNDLASSFGELKDKLDDIKDLLTDIV
jgi:hypothetical protein